MKNLKISTRLSGAFALLVAMLLTLALTSLVQLSSLRNETENITGNWLPREALHESVLVVPGRCAKLKALTSSNFGPSKAPSDAGRRALAPDPWASRPLHAHLSHALQKRVPCHPQI